MPRLSHNEIDDILATYDEPLTGDAAVFLRDDDEVMHRASQLAVIDANEAEKS